MIIVAATDNQGGMMFNRRRQSQDRILRERVLSMARESRLWMNEYTRRQFAEAPARETGGALAAAHGEPPARSGGGPPILTDNTFLEKAGSGEYCFVENQPLAACEGRIEKIILFRWNRDYPGDFFFDIDVARPPWRLAETEEFPGSSHEKITQEVYIRE